MPIATIMVIIHILQERGYIIYIYIASLNANSVIHGIDVSILSVHILFLSSI